MDTKAAQDIIAIGALVNDPAAKRIIDMAAAISLLGDEAAKKNAAQALAMGFTAAASKEMQDALGSGTSGEFRDVAVERDGGIIARFTGGRQEVVNRFGDRLLAETIDKSPLQLAAPDASKIAAE